MRTSAIAILITVASLITSTAAIGAERQQSLYFPEDMLQEIKDEAGATVSTREKAAGVELATGEWTMSGQRGLQAGNTLVMTRMGTGTASGGAATDYQIVNTVEPGVGMRPKEIVVVGSKVKDGGPGRETIRLRLAVGPDPRSGGVAFILLLTIDDQTVVERIGRAGNLALAERDPDVVSAVRTLERWGVPEPTVGLDLPVVWYCCGWE